MTKFLTGLFYLITSCTPVMAADRIVEGTSLPGVSYEKNFVKNPEAEKNANNLTVSAAIATRTTTTPLQGAGSFSIDATASAETVKFDTTTLDQYLKGQNCEAKFIFTGDATLYKVYVEQGATKVTSDLQLTNETNSKSVSVNFPCGDLSSNSHMVIEATGNGAAIKVDKVYLGGATNLGTDQISGWTSSVAGCGGTWVANTTYTCYARYVGDELEMKYHVATSGAPTSADLILNLPTGVYIETSKVTDITVNPTLGFGEARDSGVVRVPVTARYESTSTVRLQYINTATGANPVNTTLDNSVTQAAPFTFGAADTINVSFKVPVVNSSGTTLLKLNQTPWFIDARLDGANQSLGTTTVASFTEIINTGWTLTPTTGSQAVGIMCSTTNAATAPTTSASTCAAGSESAGINFAIPYPGNYEVCFQGSTFYEVDSSEEVRNNYQLVETPTNAQTLTQSSNVYAHTGLNGGSTAGASSSGRFQFNTCANFNFTSAGVKGIRLMYNQAVSGTPNNVLFVASTVDQRPKFSVKQLTVPYPMPILVNSVTSNTSGQERIERATITNSGTPTVSTQSGSWISSITDGGVGISTLNIAAGIFSGPPSCTVSQYGGGGTALCYVSTTISSTAATFVCYNSSFTLADRDFMVICQGPR